MSASDLDRLLAGGAPGWAASVFDSGAVRRTIHHGQADLAQGVPIEPGTRFRWFSVTKILTAMAVLRLAEEGRLDLDDAVHAHLPTIRPEPTSPPVRVRHLLGHDSGFADPFPAGWVYPDGRPRRTPAQLTHDVFLRHRRLRFEPGTSAKYSNLNYLILGELVARVARRPFAAYVHETFLEPLGMRSTSFEPTGAARGHERWATLRALAMAMVFRDVRLLVRYRRGPYLGLGPFAMEGEAYGGLVGPVEDLRRVGQALLGRGELDGTRVLRPESVERLFGEDGPEDAPFGLGVFRAGRMRFHGGGAGGFRAELWLRPDRNVGVAVLANDGLAPAEQVARTLVDHEVGPDGHDETRAAVDVNNRPSGARWAPRKQPFG